MKKHRACSYLVIFLIFIFVFSVRHGSAAEKLSVYVVNYPLKYFAERIGGDHVKVEFPVPAGIDPAYWNLDVEHISAYQKADLIIINGAGYAKWVNKVSLPESKMVNTSRAFKDQYITSKEVMTHSHGAEGKHAHESLAFTTWLDLSLAARQAEAIADEMARKRPALKKTFQTNCASLKKELEALDQDIQTIVSQDRSKPLMVSHPVYDYFARRYGLNIVSVHWEPGEVPSGEQWLELKKILKDHPAKWMIWEGNPLKATIEKLKGLQIESVVFDPCGNVPNDGDFLSIMTKNVNNLKRIFR
jgi:zinc transport system substrate-binding protein